MEQWKVHVHILQFRTSNHENECCRQRYKFTKTCLYKTKEMYATIVEGFIWLTTCLTACLTTCLTYCLTTCLIAYLTACLIAYLTACLSACFSVCLSACLTNGLTTCLSACLSACLTYCFTSCLPYWLTACLSACMLEWFSIFLYILYIQCIFNRLFVLKYLRLLYIVELMRQCEILG